MKYTKNIPLSLSVIFLMFLSACNTCDHSKINGITDSSQVFRFDSFFYSIGSAKGLAQQLNSIEKKDSQFYNLYLNEIFSIKKSDPNFQNIVFRHINSAQNQEIRKRVDQEFTNFGEVKEDLSKLSKYYTLNYPNRKFPKINICYGGFAGFMAWLYNDSNMLVDLDMYLGADFEAYPQFYPQFKFAYFTKDYLVQNIGRELVRREFLFYEKEKPKNMLAIMLIEGAKIYELHKLMPCREESKLFEYTADQWKWALEEESSIWQYLIKEELLFESDFNQYKPLVGEAPSSLRSGVAKGAPPRIGVFAGYQIVKKVIEKEGLENAFDLFENNSPEEILKKAKYKP